MTIDTRRHTHTHTHEYTCVPPLPPLCFVLAAVQNPEGGAGPPWLRPWHLTSSSISFPNMSFLQCALIGGEGRSATRRLAISAHFFFFVIHPDGRDFFSLPHRLLKRYLAKLFDLC